MRLIALCFIATCSVATKAQYLFIPNNGFETWEENGLGGLEPQLWGNPNTTTTVIVSQETPAHSGALSCGLNSTTTMATGGPFINSGIYAFSGRPVALHGYIKGQLQAGDYVLMSTALRRTGNTVMVGVGFIEYFESHAAFTEFTVPIDYLDPENSESCIISFTLNQVFGHATSVVLDSLWFEEGTIGIDERSTEVGLRITPNPAVDRVTIAASAQGPVHILDMRGRLVMDLSDRRKPSFTVDVSVLPAGLYSVISYNDREVEVARFMKQ